MAPCRCTLYLIVAPSYDQPFEVNAKERQYITIDICIAVCKGQEQFIKELIKQTTYWRNSASLIHTHSNNTSINIIVNLVNNHCGQYKNVLD